jgi:hypothetical protein
MTNFLDKIPQTEPPFLLARAKEVLQSQPSSIEDILKATKRIFSDKGYGWEEAILTDRWYRWPSEVGGKRFCSEEALKDYLVLRTLGIPAEYAIVGNYNNTGLAHEVAFVEVEGRKYALDWEGPIPVEIQGDSLIPTNGSQTSLAQVGFLEEDEVFQRVRGLQSGESFLRSITTPQILFIRDNYRGELKAYVSYEPDTGAITFTYRNLPSTTRVRSFLKQTFRPRRFGSRLELRTSTEFGFETRTSEKEYEVTHSAVALRGKNGKYRFQPFLRGLDQSLQRELGIQGMYDYFLEQRQNGERHVFALEDLPEQLEYIKRVFGEDNPLIRGYEILVEEGDLSKARKYLDYAAFNLQLVMENGEEGIQEGINALQQRTGYPIETTMVVANVDLLSELFLAGEATQAQQKLLEVALKLKGIKRKIEIKPENFTKLLDNFSK